MRFGTLSSFFVIAVCAILWLGNSDGRANKGNEGATGAPNDNALNRTCQNCHNNSASIQVTLDIEVSDVNQQLVSVYEPGETYEVKVRLNSMGTAQPAAYGFQILSLRNNNLMPVNSWQDPAQNVQLTTLNNGRQYAEQLQPSQSNEFVVFWEAPEAGSGPVTFYSCGNGVNGNSMSNGDGSAINSIILQEFGTTSSSEEAVQAIPLQVFPNPGDGLFQLELPATLSGKQDLRVFDISGKLRFQQEMESFGSNTAELDLRHLPAGMYFLQVEGEAGFGLERLIIR